MGIDGGTDPVIAYAELVALRQRGVEEPAAAERLGLDGDDARHLIEGVQVRVLRDPLLAQRVRALLRNALGR